MKTGERIVNYTNSAFVAVLVGLMTNLLYITVPAAVLYSLAVDIVTDASVMNPDSAYFSTYIIKYKYSGTTNLVLKNAQRPPAFGHFLIIF